MACSGLIQYCLALLVLELFLNAKVSNLRRIMMNIRSRFTALYLSNHIISIHKKNTAKTRQLDRGERERGEVRHYFSHYTFFDYSTM